MLGATTHHAYHPADPTSGDQSPAVNPALRCPTLSRHNRRRCHRNYSRPDWLPVTRSTLASLARECWSRHRVGYCHENTTDCPPSATPSPSAAPAKHRRQKLALPSPKSPRLATTTAAVMRSSTSCRVAWDFFPRDTAQLLLCAEGASARRAGASIYPAPGSKLMSASERMFHRRQPS